MNQEELLELYIHKKLNVYQIANFYNLEHKMIRAYLNKYNINEIETKLSIHKKSYTTPNDNDLLKPLAVSSHINYLCEGWHTEKTCGLAFYNQDEELIKRFVKCIHEIYNYNKPVGIFIIYNKSCKNSQIKTSNYVDSFKDINKYTINYTDDPTRLNPIVLARCGGKNMARLFVDNAYKILNEVDK